MAKTKKTKPSRTDMHKAIAYIGEKLQYLEGYCRANENIFDLFLQFNKKKSDFLAFLKEKEKEFQREENKTVEKPSKKK